MGGCPVVFIVESHICVMRTGSVFEGMIDLCFLIIGNIVIRSVCLLSDWEVIEEAASNECMFLDRVDVHGVVAQ